MNRVDVSNYKGTKGFGDKEHQWTKTSLKNANKDAYRSYREKEIDYFAQFDSAEAAATNLRQRRLQSFSFTSLTEVYAAVCAKDANLF
jgi:hypothetical protein